MYGRSLKNSFVIRYFEEFYWEVIHLKSKISMGEVVGITEGEKETGITDSSPAHLAQMIIQKLYSILESQALEIAREGGEFGASYYQEAQYIMAALADDIFLNMEWEGRKYWENNMLEMKLYNTHIAGEMVFERLIHFLKERDTVRVDLAVVYYLALSLGFQGKYRVPQLGVTQGHKHSAGAFQGSFELPSDEAEQQIRPYMENLFRFIHTSAPTLFREESWIFNKAYDHIITDSKVFYLEDWRRWMWVFIGVMAFMLGASQLVWYESTYNIQDSLDQLLTKTPLLVEED